MSDPATKSPYPGYLEETRVPIIIGYTVFTLFVAFSAVCLRIYSRAVVIKQFGNDDWASIVTFLLVFATGFCVSYNIQNGFGRHILYLTPTMITLYLRTFYVSIVLYNASLLAIKITFLLQFYRVFSTEKMRRIILIAGVIIVGWGISQLLVEIFICTPISKFWLGDAIKGHCIPNYPQWYINAAGNILTDVSLFVIPLPTIWTLRLARGQRMILLAIFSLGFFTCAISIIRIQFLKLSADGTWDNVESAGWSVGELASGLTCSCLPTLRPLLHRWCPGLTRTGRSTGYYYDDNIGSDASHPHGGGGYHNRASRRKSGGGVFASTSSNSRKSGATGNSHDPGSSFTDSGSREKFYRLSNNEGQDSDEQFILQGLQTPAQPAAIRSHGRRRGSSADDNERRRNEFATPPIALQPTTGVKTEIVSTALPGKHLQRTLGAEGSIRIERDIVQTESSIGQYMYRQ